MDLNKWKSINKSAKLEFIKGCIQHSTRGKTSTDIRSAIGAGPDNDDVTRQIQRHLMELEERQIIECQGKLGTAKIWGFTGKDGLPTNIKQDASLMLAREQLKDIFPVSILDTLSKVFSAAEKSIKNRPNDSAVQFIDKIKRIPESFPIAKVDVSESIISAVMEALIDRKRLIIKYSNRGASKTDTKDYNISPLALVAKGPVFYLVSVYEDSKPEKYPDIRNFVLHRIRQATLLNDAADYPAAFSLDNYLKEAKINPAYEPLKIKLIAYIDERIYGTIVENHISYDQKITPLIETWRGKTWWKLEATVAQSYDFRRWILGYAHHIRILEPIRLRNEIREDLQQVINDYSNIVDWPSL